MSTPPEQTELLERERRWMRPAGIAAVLGAGCFLAQVAVRASALEGDGRAEELLGAADGSADGQLLLGAILAAAAFLLFACVITFLLVAARARSERVLRQMVGLALIGALLVAAGQFVQRSSFLSAAEDFAGSEAQREEVAPEPSSGAKSEDKASESNGGSDTESSTATETSGEDDSEENSEEAADDRAQDALQDASGASAAAILGATGALAFTIGFFYAALWSMRVGLLTRFWGSLGMASAVVFVLFGGPLVIFALVWFLATGFMLVGLWFGGRPPAWEAGRAIPWPKPGEEPADAEAVEGAGREVTERPLPEDEEAQEGPSGASGPPPRKRKRRE